MINIDKNLFLQHADNITAITSGAGSMGKTCIALSLAHALNTLKQSIMFFDADNGIVNSAVQTGIQPEISLEQVVNGKKSLNQAITQINRKKFDMICGIPGSNVLETAPDGQLQIICDEMCILAHNYDKFIIDLPADDKIMNHLLPKNTDLILVCTNDQSNLVSTYQFLQKAATINKYKSLHIIVNHVNSYEEGLQAYNTLRRVCEQYIKVVPPLLGVVRRDTRIREAIRNQMLLLNCFANSEAAEDIMQIARKLLDKGK